MKLTWEGLKNRQAWEQAGIALPSYDAEAVAEKTKKAPIWVHWEYFPDFHRRDCGPAAGKGTDGQGNHLRGSI